MARFDPAAPLVHPLPDPERVELRPDLVYAHTGGRGLAMDVYLPTGRAPGRPVPAVLLVHGEADPVLLRGVRSWGQYTGWGRLLAGEGMAGVAFEHRAIAEAGFQAVVAEVGDALAAVGERVGDLGVDPQRVGLAGFSAGVPLTAAALARAAGQVRCAVLCYGPLDRLAPDSALPPLLVVRAGRDRPELNRTIDDFVSAAEQRQLAVELVHQPAATTPSTWRTTATPPARSFGASSPSCTATSGPDPWPAARTGRSIKSREAHTWTLVNARPAS